MADSISYDLEGAKSLIKKYADIADGMARQIQKDINWGGRQIRNSAFKRIRKRSSSGKETRYDPKREVVVSARGRAPNTDRGNLVRGLIHTRAKRIGKITTARVISSAKYSSALDSKKIHNRPFFKVSFNEFEKVIVKRVNATKLRYMKK